MFGLPLVLLILISISIYRWIRFIFWSGGFLIVMTIFSWLFWSDMSELYKRVVINTFLQMISRDDFRGVLLIRLLHWWLINNLWLPDVFLKSAITHAELITLIFIRSILSTYQRIIKLLLPLSIINESLLLLTLLTKQFFLLSVITCLHLICFYGVGAIFYWFINFLK
jgi:hypothetical protein